MADSDPTPQNTQPGAGASSAPTVPVPSATPSNASANARSNSIPATRPPYMPQFSAATQLILKRMKGEPSSLSSALSGPSASVPVIQRSTYEDVKRRLVMGMSTSTSMTMQMPVATTPSPSPAPLSLPTPVPRGAPAANKAPVSAIRRISSGLTASGKPISAKPPVVRTLSSESKVKKPKATTASKAAARRKRVKGQDEETSSISTVSDVESERKTPLENVAAAPHAVTKSGRQVQKPTTYNPAAMDSSTRKRPHYGKRTAEQALCKKCTRMHSPASNQMVFCDGCNDGWHQHCHDPPIEDAVIQDEGRSWFCPTCVEKRGRQIAKRQKGEQPKGPPPKESWANKTPQQRRAYLMTLSNQDLVGMIMSALEMHPDMPIFPSAAELSGGVLTRSLFAGPTVEGLFPRADANPTGQINYVRKSTGANGRSASSGPGKGKEGSQEKGDEADEEYDPLLALWPKAEKGLYSRLLPDTQDANHMVDDGDYEAFSVIVYDEKGRKIQENGMKV
ncbi:hypothetical protein OQA88_7851 [Cercophora sp. LCS_1]